MNKGILLVLGAVAVLGVLWASGAFNEKEAKTDTITTATSVEEADSAPSENGVMELAESESSNNDDKEEISEENSPEKTVE